MIGLLFLPVRRATSLSGAISFVFVLRSGPDWYLWFAIALRSINKYAYYRTFANFMRRRNKAIANAVTSMPL